MPDASCNAATKQLQISRENFQQTAIATPSLTVTRCQLRLTAADEKVQSSTQKTLCSKAATKINNIRLA